MTAPFDLLLAGLFSISLRGSLIIALGAIACAAFGRRSAALRHATWCAVLVACAMLPLVELVAPSWRIPIALPAIPTSDGAVTNGEAIRAPGVIPIDSAVPLEIPAAATPDLRQIVVVLWLAVTLTLLARLLVAHARLASLVRRSRPLASEAWKRVALDASRALGLRRAVPVLVSAELSMPVVAGLLRPKVVLPRESDEWPLHYGRAVLLHELAHVRRGDLKWLTFGRVMSAVLWFHPLVLFACLRLRAEAEQASDDLVLRAGEAPSSYAETLLDLARALAGPRPAAGIPLLRRDHLSDRIDSIISASRDRSEPGIRLRMGLALGAVLVAALAAWPSIDSSGAATAGAESRMFAGKVRHFASSPVRVLDVRVRSSRVADASNRNDPTVRLDSPELDLENSGDRAIGWVLVRLATSGLSVDRFWCRVSIAPHSRALLRIPPSRWSNEVPQSRARRFEASVTEARFADDSWELPDQELAPSAPPSATPRPGSTPRPGVAPQPGATPRPGAAPQPGSPHPGATPETMPPSKWGAGDTPAPPAPEEAMPEVKWAADEPRVQAEVMNPRGAPVVITEAWTPLRVPPPSSSEAERAFDRGHAVTYGPALALHNTSSREVVSVRLRFKADRVGHAVTVLNTPIGPGETLRMPPGRTFWGTPEAMKVQILGVRFSDGSVWGTLDSTIDTRQVWIR